MYPQHMFLWRTAEGAWILRLPGVKGNGYTDKGTNFVNCFVSILKKGSTIKGTNLLLLEQILSFKSRLIFRNDIMYLYESKQKSQLLPILYKMVEHLKKVYSPLR